MKIPRPLFAATVSIFTVLFLAGCGINPPSTHMPPGVTAADIPTTAPMVFTGVPVQIVGIHGPVEDTTGRGPEVKVIIDNRIRELLSKGGLRLVCVPPANGPYTTLEANAEYAPWDPIAGGAVVIDGQLKDNQGRLLMTPGYSIELKFFMQDATTQATATYFAFQMRENMKIKGVPEDQVIAPEVCSAK